MRATGITVLLALLVAGLSGCKEPAPQHTTEATRSAPSSSASVAPAPSPSASSALQVTTLPHEVRYESYGNTRFAFSVDVPAFLVPEPLPTNGDGRTWTWGSRAKMMVAGMNSLPSLTMAEACKDYPTRPGVQSSSIAKKTCWVTGVDRGQIYWERKVLSGDFLYLLSLSYDEQLKKQFDPIVAHVNATWKYRTCDSNRIDACGICFQRCNSTADCKGKGEVCQPVTCWIPGAASLGQGCVAPEDEFSVLPGMQVENGEEIQP